ncbi:hypothetical protein [Arcobacter sp. L]|nr:hypothetical protein [Arcobacter sp. L]BAK74059.1 hypothetical protein ABLL_2184 [Arcobacter sp. L]
MKLIKNLLFTIIMLSVSLLLVSCSKYSVAYQPLYSAKPTIKNLEEK